ncbi:hypothetical protein PSCICO_36590 [Pseudomonas cichorii]|nr:hypothetical protein PSCICO_36590 [Pseudomonas cichorii]
MESDLCGGWVFRRIYGGSKCYRDYTASTARRAQHMQRIFCWRGPEMEPTAVNLIYDCAIAF